jgi:hypothetical protein
MNPESYNTYSIIYMIDKCTFNYIYYCNKNEIVDLNLLKDNIIEDFINTNCNTNDDTNVNPNVIKSLIFMLNKHIKITGFSLITNNEK